jgi:carbon storage regulator
MLVLTRKPGERIVIGDGITVTVLEVIRGRVRLGIEASADVRILRGELQPDGGQPEPGPGVPPK